LGGGAVAVFDDLLHVVFVVAKHAPVAFGVGELGGEEGGAVAVGAMGVEEGGDGFGAEERHITIKDEEIVVNAVEGVEELLDGVAGAELFGLLDEFDPRQMLKGGADAIALIPHDD
jgi:hypothetical protein